MKKEEFIKKYDLQNQTDFKSIISKIYRDLNLIEMLTLISEVNNTNKDIKNITKDSKQFIEEFLDTFLKDNIQF